ncbi:hypothetical protein LXL04_029270 [Taraxacum kok-saghyz]
MTLTRIQDLEKTLGEHAQSLSDLKSFADETTRTLTSIQEVLTELTRVRRHDRPPPSSGGDGGHSGDSSFNGSFRQTRCGKVEFPRFSGTDVESWLLRCDHFFQVDETPDNMKLKYAVIHLEGDAMQWHQSYMKTRGCAIQDLHWPDYVRSITSRFGTSMYDDAMEQLTSLYQTSSLQDYCQTFDLLLNKVTISEEYAINIFLRGLKPEMKGHIKMFKPKALRDTYALARLQDANLTALAGLKLSPVPTTSTPKTTTPSTFTNSKGGQPSYANKLPLLATPPNSVPMGRNTGAKR